MAVVDADDGIKYSFEMAESMDDLKKYIFKKLDTINFGIKCDAEFSEMFQQLQEDKSELQFTSTLCWPAMLKSYQVYFKDLCYFIQNFLCCVC